MAYRTRNTVNRLARKELYLNPVVSERSTVTTAFSAPEPVTSILLEPATTS